VAQATMTAWHNSQIAATNHPKDLANNPRRDPRHASRPLPSPHA
jgi:hypothetical protein